MFVEKTLSLVGLMFAKNNKGKYYVTEWIVGKNDTRERFIKILQGVNNGD